jgi:TfoX/Sxy family transcriptional regulator of competence genes
MFGQLAGFVNGNMFSGIHGNAIFVRLPEAGREELLREEGAQVFEPMPGRPMREYVVLPEAWASEPERIRAWVVRSLESSAAMPAKAPKAKRAQTK